MSEVQSLLRSRLAAAILIWCLAGLAWLVANPFIFRAIPGGVGSLLFLILAFLAPLWLILWSLAAARRWRLSAIGAGALVALLWTLAVTASEPLLTWGQRQYVASHRAVFDSVVADARAGRLDTGLILSREVTGVRRGIRYEYFKQGERRIVNFPWIESPLYSAGVTFDERCIAGRKWNCGAPLVSPYRHYVAMP